MNICDKGIFPGNVTFLSIPKNGGPKHDFFVLLNAPVGVHEKIVNAIITYTYYGI